MGCINWLVAMCMCKQYWTPLGQIYLYVAQLTAAMNISSNIYSRLAVQ